LRERARELATMKEKRSEEKRSEEREISRSTARTREVVVSYGGQSAGVEAAMGGAQ
jgi:hypothetical protein